MAERESDHYVFQNLDLLGNKITNVRELSSDDNLTLVSSPNNNKKVIVNSESQFKDNVLIQGTDQYDDPVPKTLTVSGTSSLKDNVVIGTSETDTTHNLTVAGVKIKWDSNSNSLIFEKVQTSNG